LTFIKVYEQPSSIETMIKLFARHLIKSAYIELEKYELIN